MINPGYKIKAEDVEKLENFKKTAAYNDYLVNISNSPIYSVLADKKLKEIDVSKDIKKLQQIKAVPQNMSGETLNKIFRASLRQLSIGLIADTVILREIEEIEVEKVIKNLSEDANITYLLGKADKECYERAQEMLDNGEIEDDSITYRGLVAYKKRVKAGLEKKINKITTTKKKKESNKIDSIDSNELFEDIDI